MAPQTWFKFKINNLRLNLVHLNPQKKRRFVKNEKNN